MNNKLFLTGSPRSGTSAFASALDAQESIVMTNELGIFSHWDSEDYSVNLERIITSEEGKPFLEETLGRAGLSTPILLNFLRENQPRAEEVLDFIVKMRPADIKWAGDKAPFTYLGLLDKLLDRFPDSKAIVIVRDGRDVTASCVLNYWKRYKSDLPL